MQRYTARASVLRGTINSPICLLVHYQLKHGRTHEPCVPTCIRAARPIHHFTHQYGQGGYVGTHGSCVRLARNNQLVNLFTRSLLTKTWADARACVPTCIRAARPIHHFTHQYGQCGYVEMHGSCVRSARNNQLANLFTRPLSTMLRFNLSHFAR